MDRHDEPTLCLDDHYIIGVNTGTSGDGVDVVAITFSNDAYRVLGGAQLTFDTEITDCLQHVLNHTQITWKEYAFLESALAKTTLEAIKILRAQLDPSLICDLIACHGQTLSYRAEDTFTHQMINPYPLVDAFSCPVAYDFRRWDMAHGGRGAPLIPLFHEYLCHVHQKQSYAFLNIGGIANISIIQNNITRGYDIGPGCALLDTWYRQHHDAPMQDYGAWATQGTVLPELLDTWFKDPVLTTSTPQGMAREYFIQACLQHVSDYRPEDVQRSLLELSAQLITRSLKKEGIDAVCCFGGGIHIHPLIERLRETALVEYAENFGFQAQWMEPALFAWLGWMRLHARRHSSLPSITGGRPSQLGVLCFP